MKNILLITFLTLTMVLGFVTFAHADSNIIEAPEIKIIIDGVTKTYSDVPISKNGRTLLPLRAILVDLGIKNDDEHIIFKNC